MSQHLPFHLTSRNHPDRLDEALSRPGRFDVHIPFYDATYRQVIALFKHFFSPSDLSIDTEKATQEMHRLAEMFAKEVFAAEKLADGNDLAVSMAGLQGFLLKHRKDPKQTVEKAGEWIKGLWEAQQAKVLKRLERIKLREIRFTQTSPVAEGSASKATDSSAAIIESKNEESKADFLPATPVSPISPTLHTA